MVIRFYDKETFALRGELPSFISTTQTKYINAAGTFEITADAIPDGLDLESVVCVTGPECETYCGEVTQIGGSLSGKGETYTIKGRELLGLLSERMPIYNGKLLTYSAGMPRETMMKDMLEKTFVTPDLADRAVSQIQIRASQGRGSTGAFSCTAENSVLDNAIDAGEKDSFGLEVTPDFTAKRYIVDIIAPRETPVLISLKFDNLADEEYLQSRAAHKNVAYYSYPQEGSDLPVYGAVDLDAGTGFGRKERWITASSTSESEEAVQAIIRMQLGNFKPVLSFSGEYQASQTFLFGQDFSLGDWVVFAGKTGSATSQVIGFTQTHGAGKYTLQLLFGSNVLKSVTGILRSTWAVL